MLAEVSHYYRKLIETQDDVKLGNDLINDIPLHTTQFPVLTFSATMTAFGTIHAAYIVLVNAANGGDATAVSARNQYRKTTWLPQVDKIAVLVNNACGGDPTIILMSGFHATKQTATPSVVPVQVTVAGSSPAVAEFKYESKTVVDSHAFALVGTIAGDAAVTQSDDTIIITTNKATTVVVHNTNNKKGSVKNLNFYSGLRVNWAMIAKNPAGSSTKSSDLTLMIQ